jgi:hypothetical protein
VSVSSPDAVPHGNWRLLHFHAVPAGSNPLSDIVDVLNAMQRRLAGAVDMDQERIKGCPTAMAFVQALVDAVVDPTDKQYNESVVLLGDPANTLGCLASLPIGRGYVMADRIIASLRERFALHADSESCELCATQAHYVLDQHSHLRPLPADFKIEPVARNNKFKNMPVVPHIVFDRSTTRCYGCSKQLGPKDGVSVKKRTYSADKRRSHLVIVSFCDTCLAFNDMPCYVGERKRRSEISAVV